MPPQFDIYPLRDPGLVALEQPGIFMGLPNALWAPSPQLINSWRSATSYPNYAQQYMQGYPQPPPVPRTAEAVALRHAARFNRLGYQNLLLRDNGTVIGATPETTPQYVQAGPIQFNAFGPVLPVAELGQYVPTAIGPLPFAPNPAEDAPGSGAPPTPPLYPPIWGYPNAISMMQSQGTSPWEGYGLPYYWSVPAEGPPGYQAFMTDPLGGFPLYAYTQSRPPPAPPPFNVQLATADTNPATNPDWRAMPGKAWSGIKRGAGAVWAVGRRAPGAVAGAFSGVSLPLMAGGVGAGVIVGAYEYGRASASLPPDETPAAKPQYVMLGGPGTAEGLRMTAVMPDASAPPVRQNPQWPLPSLLREWPAGYTGMARQAVLDGTASLPPPGYDPYKGCPEGWGYADFADGSVACLPPDPVEQASNPNGVVGITPAPGPASWGSFAYHGGFWPWNGAAPLPGRYTNPHGRGSHEYGHTWGSWGWRSLSPPTPSGAGRHEPPDRIRQDVTRSPGARGTGASLFRIHGVNPVPAGFRAQGLIGYLDRRAPRKGRVRPYTDLRLHNPRRDPRDALPSPFVVGPQSQRARFSGRPS